MAIDMSKEAMKLALEAYMAAGFGNSTDFALQKKAYDLAVKALAEQPAQQEPVAQYIGEGSEGSLVQLYDDLKKGTNFYTSPPAQRTWVGLTDEEIDEATAYANPHCDEFDFARAIEAKLREKNS